MESVEDGIPAAQTVSPDDAQIVSRTSGVYLAGIRLPKAGLAEANLRGATLDGADLQGAIYTNEQTSKEKCEEAFLEYPCPTLFPKGFDPEAAGMVLIR